MFTIEAKLLVSGMRPAILHAYQEQGDLEVVFKARDGEQKCSRLALNYVSDFYKKQLDGRDNHENPPVFNYDYSKETIKYFLDLVHGKNAESVSLFHFLELMKFLRYEAKSDESTFEKKLLALVIEELESADLTIETKLLICLITDTFDNFEGVFEQAFFEECTVDDIGNRLIHLDYSCEPNKKLKDLLTIDNDNEIASEICFLARRIKYRRNLPVVELICYHNDTKDREKNWIKVNIGTGKTVSQLKDALCILRMARFTPMECTKKFPTTLFYDEQEMEGNLDQYGLKNGDKIRYRLTKVIN